MNKVNYHSELKKRLESERESGNVPHILLHSCCAPCSSTCLEFLTRYARVTVFYFNPNITEPDEYRFRLEEQKRLIREMTFMHPVDIIEGRYDPEEFFRLAQGLEDAPERGPRCLKCYRYRLEETAKIAAENGIPNYMTTLTLSPLKPSDIINSIGLNIAGGYVPTDFKKEGGYLRSIELSKQYGLYRQNYCGCVFSKRTAKGKEET